MDSTETNIEKIQRLHRALEQAEAKTAAARLELHTALLELSRYKTGDIVRVTTPQKRYKFGEDLQAAETEVLPDKVEYGKVTQVHIVHDALRLSIAPRTKTGHYATRQTIKLALDAVIEKVTEEEAATN